MAYPTSVNDQITDSVTQTAAADGPDGPTLQLLANLLASLSAARNDGLTDGQINAALAMVAQIAGLGGAAATAKIGKSDVPDNMLALLSALKAAQGPVS